MNIISKLTLRHLKQNKKRTVVRILGIAAATALITTMLVGITSFFSFFGTVSLHEDGNWHGQFENLTKEQVEELKADTRIASVGIVDGNASITGVRMHSDVADRMKLGNVMHLDGTSVKQNVTCDYEGVLPSSQGEIAVEEQFLKDNNLNVKLGDTISFDVGGRYLIDPDGKKVYMAGNYHSNEGFDVASEETCKVTAILHSNAPTDGFDILLCMDEGEVPQENFVNICMTKLDFRSSKELKDIANDHNLTLSDRNTELFISVFSFDRNSKGMVQTRH